jgi:hypothetical protein
MINALKNFWNTHVQKTVATALGMLAFVDLTGYGDAITGLVGAKGYAAVRLVGAAAIAWRAMQSRKPEVLPPPVPR